MEIRAAGPSEAHLVHGIMMEAYGHYRWASPPSSALDETVDSVREALTREGAALALIDGRAVGSVRYYDQDGLYFHRLGVVPAFRRKGAASAIIDWLEERAREGRCSRIWCKVRASEAANIRMYAVRGYSVVSEVTAPNPNGDLVRLVHMQKALQP